MTKILDNNNLSTVDGEYNTVLSPADKLSKGIKAILEIFEEQGVPKYKVNKVAKIFGSILSVKGVPQGTYNFTTDPNEELTRLDGLIDSLDGSKADKDTAFVYIDLGIQDLVNRGTFDIPGVQRLTRDNAVMLEVSDNTTGKHRNFMRTQISADGNIITFVESVDMGTKKAPSINEIDVNVANSTGTYTEVALQNRLTQIDLDNIASIPQKQNSTDNALKTTDKTVVGAINEVLASGGGGGLRLIADFSAEPKKTWTTADMISQFKPFGIVIIQNNRGRCVAGIYWDKLGNIGKPVIHLFPEIERFIGAGKETTQHDRSIFIEGDTFTLDSYVTQDKFSSTGTIDRTRNPYNDLIAKIWEIG